MEHSEPNQIPAMAHAPPGRSDLRYGSGTERANSINVQKLTDLMPYLHRFACSLTHDADQAADLVQDTVERGLRKSHLFDGANLRAWLTTICRRIFLNNLRRDKLRGFEVCIDDVPADRLCAPAEQDNQVHFADVAAALKRLPENDRLIISLCSVTGMTYLEVAERLGAPIGTVRSRLSRARSKLARLVRDGCPREEGPQSLVRVVAPRKRRRIRRHQPFGHILRATRPGPTSPVMDGTHG